MIAAGDLANNGIQDLVIAGSLYPNLFVALGNGTGGFGQWAPAPTAAFAPASITLGDLNLDGNLDAVVIDGANLDISISYGNGQGSFNNQTYTFNAFGNFPPSSVAVADLNLDGIPDLVGTSIDPGGVIGAVFVSLGNGTGKFTHLRQFPTHGQLANGVVVADFNGDRIPDVALANGTENFGKGSVAVMLGNGDGTFQPVQRYLVGRDPLQVVTGDFNGDGILDIAALTSGRGNADNRVCLLLGKGDGTFTLSPQSFAAGRGVVSMVAADFNGDHKLDLAFSEGGTPGYVSVFLGNGDSTFQSPTSFKVGNVPLQLITADFNGDGKPDLATVDDESSTVTILINVTKWPSE